MEILRVYQELLKEVKDKDMSLEFAPRTVGSRINM